MTGKLLAGSVLEDQIRLETSAVEMGVRHYRRQVRDAIDRESGSSLKPAERLLLHWLDPLAAAIRQHKRSVRSGKAGDGSKVYGNVMGMISADRMAVATLRTVLSACMATHGHDVPLQSIAYSVGRDIIAEIHMDMLRREKRESLHELDQRFRNLHTTGVNWWAKRTLEKHEWERKVCMHLGVRLVWLLIATASCNDYEADWSQAFHHEKRLVTGRHGAREKAFLVMDRRAAEIIEDGHSWRQYMRPRYLPMLVRPYPWQADAQGGYVRIRTPFISKPTQAQKAAIKEADLKEIFECLNAVNAQSWTISDYTLDVQDTLWEQGGAVAGIPRRDPIPKPPRPYGIDTDEAIKAEWKAEAAKVYRRNIELKGERKLYIQARDVANTLKGKTFWFPHQMDFRTRCYPIPIHLNHQGSDVFRGLLQFAEARPVTDRGMFWLKVHAANCYGIKGSFADRAGWVDGNADTIAHVYTDPVRHMDWWRHQPNGKPRKEAFQLLAACAALCEPEKYGARLPVQMDGTCNGLQHYSAMGRDPEGAAAVNLIPAERPADIYASVAERIAPKVAEDARLGVAEARLILEHLSRDLVKQPVMTTVYGVKIVGARNQIMKKALALDVGTELDERARNEAIYRAAMYLSRIVLDGVAEACPAAKAIMDWLVIAAREVTTRRVGKRREPTHTPIQWATPLGFPVVQPYRKYSTVEIKTVMQQVRLLVEDDSVPVKSGKQIDGFAPNFVHSIDAAHMFMTAREMNRRGLAFAAVHDSFWTHASDVDELHQVAREQFVALHKRPILPNLKAELERRNKISLPDLPPTGSLNLDAVLAASYFIS